MGRRNITANVGRVEVGAEGMRRYDDCFGCGRSNPYGLGLKMAVCGDTVVAHFTPLPHHQGWPDIVHGGVLCTLLYEVMENWSYLNGIVTMVRSLDARLRRPAFVGQKLTAVSRLENRTGREMDVAATLESEDGIVAVGSASLVEINSTTRKRLGI